MAFSSVTDFLGQFQGGARPNRYRITIQGAQAGASIDPRNFSFLCRASSIPASTLGMVEVAYMGRLAKVSGDKTFEDWQVTVYNDLTWSLRAEFEKWVDGMLSNESNRTDNNNAATYHANAVVQQLSRDESAIPGATYLMQGIFPVSVGPIALAYDTNNQVETFDVTFAVNWWENSNTT